MEPNGRVLSDGSDDLHSGGLPVVVEERLAVVETEIRQLRDDMRDIKELTIETRDMVMKLSGKVHRNGNGNAAAALVDAIKFVIAALLGALGFKVAGGG